jgi:GAF domain-containing protein
MNETSVDKPDETMTGSSAQRFLNQAWQFLTGPHPSVQEVGERRRAQLLATTTLILTIAYISALLSGPKSYGQFVVLLLFTALAYALSRTPYYAAGTYFFCFSFTAFAYVTLYLGTASGYSSAITTSVHVALIVASILLSLRGLTALVLFVAIASALAPAYSKVPILLNGDYFRDTGVAVIMGIILLGANVFRAVVERDRLKQLRVANRELEDLTVNLEQRVNERTAQLETAGKQTSRRVAQLQAITELSETIAQLRELGELFQTTTNLISERFGFYHVGIFLVDNDREYAIMQATNSAGGKQMLERSHRLRLGTGVVGYAAQTGQPRIALDVGADAVFFDNPDLPNTRSEAALPMKSRGQTIAVLDVQSTEAGAFSDEDLQILTALANQVSIALENARLLTETRAALAQVQEVYDEFTRAEWSRAVVKAEQTGFRYQLGRIEMIEETLNTPEVVSAVKTGETVRTGNHELNGRQTTMAIPVKLRGEVIGVLQIESNDPAKTWQNDEISLVEAVAERAAFALENARLFQDARRRAAKERLISEATTKISAALNIENILQTTAEELERVLGGSEVLIKFQNKEPK